MEQKPSIGRIVIYSIPAHDVRFPAIITEVLGSAEAPTKTCNLTVFGMGGVAAQCVRTVAHVSELRPESERPNDHERDVPGNPRWDWPPRV